MAQTFSDSGHTYDDDTPLGLPAPAGDQPHRTPEGEQTGEDALRGQATSARPSRRGKSGGSHRGTGKATAQKAHSDDGEATLAAVDELEAQGFTVDEAVRLVDISDRVANSHEAREAEAMLRRLRFQRWLVARGRLDEFSA